MLPMKERLPFAIRFAYMDLTQLRRGDWLNLQDDIVDFMGFRTGRTPEEARQQARRVGVSPWPVAGQLILRFTQDAIQTLQAEVRQVLTGVMDRHEDRDAQPRSEQPTREAPPDIPEIRAKMWLDWNHDQPDDVGLLIDGELRSLFLLTLVFLLYRDLAHVQRCPECGTIFYRVRKQRYCNRTCTNRANMREWRKTEKGKEGESTLNHGRYKARCQRQVGPNAKVTIARRPQSKQQKQGG